MICDLNDHSPAGHDLGSKEPSTAFAMGAASILDVDGLAQLDAPAGLDLDWKISARGCAERGESFILEMAKKKQWIRDQMAACTSSSRHDWCRRLDEIQCTAAGADHALEALRDAVEREKILWVARSDGAVPADCARNIPAWLMGLAREPWPLARNLDLHDHHWRADMNAEIGRRVGEAELGLIASSLGALASLARCYRAGAI